MATATELEDTGERMIPEFHRGTLIYAEHLIRYKCVAELVAGKVVLDIASGSGYGSALLAGSAATVFGVDASKDAVNYAVEHFGAKNITFIHGDATSIPLEDNSVDVVVTFETIEHIADYEKFITEMSRVLRPDGLAIISTPNDLEFAEGNHFHLHEFERDELLKLIAPHFANVAEFYQATWKYVAIDTIEHFQDSPAFPTSTLNLAPLSEKESLYFFFLCSNREISERIAPIAALGEHYSDRALAAAYANNREMIDSLNGAIKELRETLSAYDEELTAIKVSRSYRLATNISRLRARLPFLRRSASRK